MNNLDLTRLREDTPIIELAERLGLEVRRKQAHCYNSQAHKNGDKKPSLGFDTKTNRYKCFACGVSGSVIDLYMALKGVDVKEAIQELGNGHTAYYQIPTTTKPTAKKTTKPQEDTSGVYETLLELTTLDKETAEYLLERGLTGETTKRFNLTAVHDYATINKQLKEQYSLKTLQEAGIYGEKGNLVFYKHKVVIPFYERGKVVFLQGRNLDGTHPKYLNLARDGKPLFNAEVMQTLADNDKVYLCEGVFDAMRLTQEGYNAVAILGVTDFTEEKVNLFKRFDVVLVLDNDEAGREMTQAIAKLFYLTGKQVKIKQLPEGIKDITDFFLQHDKAGFEALPEVAQEIEGLPKTATEDLPDYYKTLGDGSKNLIGIETGITALDRATMGLSGVVVLGGIAGQGKTSLALQIAYEACVLGTPVIFYSLEMPKRAIYTKILNRLSSVSYADILLKGRPYLDPEAHDNNLMGERVDFHNLFTKDEREALDQAREKLVKIGNRLYIRSRERGEQPINFTSLEAEINLVKLQHNAERVLVVVDHLQVFDFRRDEKERATDQIDKESKLIDRFKETSEKTDTPILLISQKNKQGFNSSGLESIKGSVDIVYLADVVMFLESEGEKDESIFSNGYRVTKLVISKNRYNPPKTLTFTFNGKSSNFEAQTE